MGRPKGSKNKIQTGITYPRKCDECDYISNNPSMFHYHKKTHASIIGKFCDYGCGLPALFTSTTGTFCCSQSHMQCLAVKQEFSTAVSKQWEMPESDERRVVARTTFIERMHKTEIIEKAKRTKWAKWGMEDATAEQWKEFRKYARSCRKLSQKWAKDNGHQIGRQTFHVDNIYSIVDGYRNKISPLIISHPANLRILEATKNSSKGSKSEITLKELLFVTGNN